MALGRGGHSTKGMQRARQDDYSDEDDCDVRAAAPMRLARQAIDRMGLRACRLPSSARTCARIAAALVWQGVVRTVASSTCTSHPT